MKDKFKKLLFPFFKERHQFLLKKWWFRLLIVGYVLVFVVMPFCLFLSYIDPYEKCYDTVIVLFDYGSEVYNQQVVQCRENVRAALIPAISYAVIGTLLIHYITQLIFFKIVIDFIALGTKGKRKKQI